MSLGQSLREFFVYLCPKCGAPYHTVVENGKSKFLHSGLTSTTDKTKLSTPECIPYHNYVVFSPCGHCCPDVFEECRACRLGLPDAIDRPSHPTEEECFCHYCLPEPETKKPELRSTRPKARKKKDVPQTRPSSPIRVFISYSHKDEEFKDELVTVLAGLQRRGVIDAWQDRRIEAGDEWYQEIQDAMNECDLAILLVSANFIASSFIQDEELTRLLQRRMEEGLRVVPVIVKPCLWQSEPALKGIQGLPRDGKPVITFSKENGDRDQVWTDIATAIEKRAK